MSNPEPSVNLDSFDLELFKVTYDPEMNEEGEYEYDRSEALEVMQGAIPDDGVLLNVLEDEVVNWTTWETEDYYYVIPWAGEAFDWALFRISLDDNWGQYNWDACARINGLPKQPIAAAKLMLEALFKDWGLELEGADRNYREFIDGL